MFIYQGGTNYMIKRKGQAILEFALVLPIFLLILCAIADFGRILYSSAHLNLITQDAVRLASLRKSDNEIISYIKNNVYLIDKSDIAINITPVESYRKSGEYTTIKISYEIKYVTPFIKLILPSPFYVNTQSTIRVE